MKLACQRKALRIVVDLEGLLLLLKRHGYLKKEHILVKEDCAAVVGPTVLPDDARLIGARTDPSSQSLVIEIEADSFGDALLWEGDMRTRRIHLSREMPVPS